MKKIITIIGIIGFACITAFLCFTLYRCARAAQQIEMTARNIEQTTKRLDKQLDDDFWKNFKNNIEINSYATNKSINNLTEVSTAATNLLENIDRHAGATLDRLPLTMDKINSIATRIDTETLPVINRTIARADVNIDFLTTRSLTAINHASDVLASTNTLINRPELPELLNRSAMAADSISRLANSADNSLLIVNSRLPGLLDRSDETLQNVSGITFQMNAALVSFNKPLTTRQKIVRFLGESLFKSAPVLLKR